MDRYRHNIIWTKWFIGNLKYSEPCNLKLHKNTYIWWFLTNVHSYTYALHKAKINITYTQSPSTLPPFLFSSFSINYHIVLTLSDVWLSHVWIEGGGWYDLLSFIIKAYGNDFKTRTKNVHKKRSCNNVTNDIVN